MTVLRHATRVPRMLAERRRRVPWTAMSIASKSPGAIARSNSEMVAPTTWIVHIVGVVMTGPSHASQSRTSASSGRRPASPARALERACSCAAAETSHPTDLMPSFMRRGRSTFRAMRWKRVLGRRSAWSLLQTAARVAKRADVEKGHAPSFEPLGARHPGRLRDGECSASDRVIAVRGRDATA